MVMTALRHVAVLAKGRCEDESFSTMRSSCGTYSWLPLARDGTLHTCSFDIELEMQVFYDDAVQLRHVQLVALGPRWHAA